MSHQLLLAMNPSTDPSLCILTNQNAMQTLCCVSPVEGEQSPSHDLPHSFKLLLAVDDFNGCFNPTTLKLKDKEWVRHFTVPSLVTLWVLHVCSFQCINDLLQENCKSNSGRHSVYICLIPTPPYLPKRTPPTHSFSSLTIKK